MSKTSSNMNTFAVSAMAGMYVGEMVKMIAQKRAHSHEPSLGTKSTAESTDVLNKLLQLISALAWGKEVGEELRRKAFNLALEAADAATRLPAGIDTLNHYLQQCEAIAVAAWSKAPLSVFEKSSGTVPRLVLQLAKRYDHTRRDLDVQCGREETLLGRLREAQSSLVKNTGVFGEIYKLTNTTDIHAAMKKLRAWSRSAPPIRRKRAGKRTRA
jgi:hypothetical protein